MEIARLMIDNPGSGAWNMSVDQAILETAEETGLITLRFYQWDQPTLSLGYFQSHHDRDQHAASVSCPLVRRKTGGGAILHDRELTYSLCIPSSNRWSSQNTDLYERVHLELIKYFRELGSNAYLYRNESEHEFDDSERKPGVTINQGSFMCFERRSDGDICLKGQKIVGSAQRRLKNSLLQHGSILLAASPFAPQLLGISDLSRPYSNERGNEAIIEKLLGSLQDCFRVTFEKLPLLPKEARKAQSLSSEYFETDAWNLRR